MNLNPNDREKWLDEYYQNPARVHPGLYKTKMCAKFVRGTCLRGNHNAKPQASGVR